MRFDSTRIGKAQMSSGRRAEKSPNILCNFQLALLSFGIISFPLRWIKVMHIDVLETTLQNKGLYFLRGCLYAVIKLERFKESAII